MKQKYILVAMLVFATLYFYQDPGSNGNSRLDMTRAIVEQGSINIDSYHQQINWDTIDEASFNSHYYTDKGIGSSLLAVLPYFLLYKLSAVLGIALNSVVIKHFVTAVVMGGAFTVNGFVLYLIAEKISANRWKALLATLAVSMGTMLWPYSTTYFGHVLAATFLTLAFYNLFISTTNPEIISAKNCLWAGLFAGFAFITEYTTAFVIVGLLVYALYILRKQNPRQFIRLSLVAIFGALIPLSMFFAFNYAIYGNLLAVGYSHEALQEFQAGHATGFMGIGLPDWNAFYRLTIDPQRGLFWQSPVLVLSILGYFFMLKKKIYRAEGLLSVFAITSMLLMNAGYYMWWGGWAFGPRLIIPALPFFIIPFAVLPDNLNPFLEALSIVSIGQMLIPLMGQIQFVIKYQTVKKIYLVDGQPFKHFSILYQYGLPLIVKLFRAGTPSWNLGHAIGIPFLLSGPTFIIVESLLTGLFYRQTKAPGISSGPMVVPLTPKYSKAPVRLHRK
ncbi:MAG TPA: hypothetical protein VMT73_15240 [Anaerolineales bacterium]|nr:hypothetical protein [Anaerolineales bacterium]